MHSLAAAMSSRLPRRAVRAKPTCLGQVKGKMNMGKRCLQSRPIGPAPKISPARKGWVHRLFVCSLGAADQLRRVGREMTSLNPLQHRRVKSKGAPGLAFETWDPQTNSHWKHHPPLCHPRSEPGFPTSPLSPATSYVVLLKENHMELTEAATLDRKSGGAEGSAVPRTLRGYVFRPERSVVERSAASVFSSQANLTRPHRVPNPLSPLQAGHATAH